MNPDVPRPNPDHEFRRMADVTPLGPQLSVLRNGMFDLASEFFGEKLADLPDPVRARVAEQIGHLARIEEASNIIARTARSFEEALTSKSTELPSIIQSAKREVASKSLREGTVGEFLQELGSVDQISDFACLIMQENFRTHSSLASIFLDDSLVQAIRTDEVSIGEGSDAPFYSADYSLKSVWTFKAKETSFDLNDFVVNALEPAAKTFIARHKTPGIFEAIQVFERRTFSEDTEQPTFEPLIDASALEPFRSGLASQVIGIFPLVHGDRHIGAMVNLIDRDAVSTRVNRHPILELEGIAAATTRAITRTGRIPSDS